MINIAEDTCAPYPQDLLLQTSVWQEASSL